MLVEVISDEGGGWLEGAGAWEVEARSSEAIAMGQVLSNSSKMVFNVAKLGLTLNHLNHLNETGSLKEEDGEGGRKGKAWTSDFQRDLTE